MATVTPIEDLRRSPTAALFEGGDTVPVSIFITEYPEAGQGPDLHVHPYAEAFVVLNGTGVWTAGDEQMTVTAGHVVTVPPETPHGFKSTGDGVLRVVSVHPSPEVHQRDL